MSKPNTLAVVLGNGPSLRGFDFARELVGVDTFGMNSAFRYWDQINWYPTYFVACDPDICSSHKKDFARLVRNRKTYGIKQFLLDVPAVEYLKEKNLFCNDITNYRFWLIRNYKMTSLHADIFKSGGAIAILWASFLGYKTIIFIGIDANYCFKNIAAYKQCFSSKINTYKTYEILSKTSDNSNYFFDNYLQQGDMITLSNTFYDENIMHINAFNGLSRFFNRFNYTIINANVNSNITAFPKMTWSKAKQEYFSSTCTNAR